MLKKLRKKQGLTQIQLAELVGITQQAVSEYETNVSKPSLDTAYRLAEILGKEVFEIFKPQREAK